MRVKRRTVAWFTVAWFVKNLRSKFKLSKTDLGKMLGYTPQYIYDIEKGTSRFPVKFCYKLLAKLGHPEHRVLEVIMEEELLRKYGPKKRS